MAEDWMPVAYASFVVNGLRLAPIPEASGPMFFSDRTTFNGCAWPQDSFGNLEDAQLTAPGGPGLRPGQRAHAWPGSGDCGPGTTFASIFDARLAALDNGGKTGLLVGPYGATDDLSVLFAPGVNAVGFDVFQIDGDHESITIQLFDMADQLIASTGIQVRQKGRFFGAIDESHLIGRISLQVTSAERDEGSRDANPDLDIDGPFANDNPRPGVAVRFGLGLASLGVGWRPSSAVAHLEGR